MKLERAPRSKKRVSCGLTIAGDHYKGIVLDVSASGLFVQTNVKPAAGVLVEMSLTLPGRSEQVVFNARVVRKKAVPAALLAAAGGGVGLVVDDPPKAYLDFIARVSPEQAEYVAKVTDAMNEESSGSPPKPESAAKRFRIHAVETATGRKSTFLVSCEGEEEASAEVLDQLGTGWQVIFVERV